MALNTLRLNVAQKATSGTRTIILASLNKARRGEECRLATVMAKP